MNNEIKSDDNLWISYSGKLSSIGPDISSPFSQVLTAIQDTNDILRYAPSDVGGTIPCNVTSSNVNELLSKWETLQSFANGIHYEVDEYIDIPFTKEMNKIVEGLYNLSPKDFRTKSNFLWFQRGQSLEDVFLKIITDSSAKASYEAQVKNLDEDVPDASFDEILRDALYWEREIRKTEQLRVYANDFLAKHKDKWNSYTADEKLKYINEYTLHVGKELGKKPGFELFPHNVVTSVQYESSDPKHTPDGSYGYTYATSLDGKIYINNDFGSSKDPLYSLSFLLTTVTHEARHQCQAYEHATPSKYNLPAFEQTDWFDRIKYPSYWVRPWEIDARSYSSIIH